MKSISAGIVVGAGDTVRLDATSEVDGSYGAYGPVERENSRAARGLFHSKRKCVTVWRFDTYRSWVSSLF